MSPAYTVVGGASAEAGPLSDLALGVLGDQRGAAGEADLLDELLHHRATASW